MIQYILAEAFNHTVDNINLGCLRNLWQARHTDDITSNCHDHLRTCINHDILNVEAESLRCSIELRVL